MGTLAPLRSQLAAELLNFRTVVLDALASASVTTFEGYGNSGQIENVEVGVGADGIAMPAAAITQRSTPAETRALRVVLP